MNEIERRVWAELSSARSQGVPNTLISYAETIKRAVPDIRYDEFCTLVMKYSSRIGGFRNEVFVPDAFCWFIKAFSNLRKPQHVYLPFATGLEFGLFPGQAEILAHFYNKDQETAFKTILSINTTEEMPSGQKYDFIVSALPLGPVNGHFFGCEIVEKCIPLLADDGFCVYTFSKSLVTSSGRKWMKSLELAGLYCNAIIDMPAASYAPASMVETEIAIFSKQKRQNFFIANLEEASYAEKISQNFLTGKINTKGIKLGIFTEEDTLCYSDFLTQSRLDKKCQSISKAYNAPIIELSEVASVHLPDRNNEFHESGSAVYVPKLGNSPAVTDISAFHIKAQNYFQIIVDESRMHPRFLAFFLNTEAGLSIRQMSYQGATIKAFNAQILRKLKIPCPAIEKQSEYLSVYDQLEVLRVDIEALKTRFQKNPASYKAIKREIKDINNTGDKFQQWIESLPYPIATILKRYSVTEDPSRKQETLFYFFEAYAIFEATLLTAAYTSKVKGIATLGDVSANYFERASFGNWVRLDRALSMLYLELLSARDEDRKNMVLSVFKTADEKLIQQLCSKDTSNALDEACKYRNTWKGHSGITSDAIYAEHVATLDSVLRRIQECVKDLYERVRLVRPIKLTYSNGIFSNQVEILTGSNSIFPKATIESISPLDDKKLYLQVLDTGEMLELPPYFILKNSPSNVKNACYFYNRVESGNTRYVSYHFEGKPEDTETGEEAFTLIREMLGG